MKKFGKSFFAAALMVMVLSACEKEPISGPSGNLSGDGMITFSSNIRKPVLTSTASRVNGDMWDSGDDIGIYMLKAGEALDAPEAIFADNANRHYQVKPISEEEQTKGIINPFLISEAIYYPLENPNHDFKFVAYHPYSEEIDEYFNIPVDVTENKPVMYAETDNQPWFNFMQEGVEVSPIPMTFSHKMARIIINILPGEGFDFSELNGMTVDFINANATGKFNLISHTFSDVQFGDVSLAINRDIEEETMTASMIIIPNDIDIEGRSLIFTHTNSYKGTDTYPLIHQIDPTMKFEPGKEYTYTATVTRNKVFLDENFTIDDWNPADGGNEMPGETESLGERRLRESAYSPNCYVWDREGIFSIPVIKAYGMWIYGPQISDFDTYNPMLEYATQEDADIEPVIIWGDDPSVADYTILLGNQLGGYKATIDINYAGESDEVVPMNMLIGLKIQGVIRWSWHLWVVDPENNPVSEENIKGLDLDGALDGDVPTYDPYDPTSDPDSPEYDPIAHPRSRTKDIFFMDRNLGAKNATVGDPGSMGLVYQWGRKDPFTGVNSWADPNDFTKLYKVVDGEAVEITGNDFADPVTTSLFNGLMGQIPAPVTNLEDIVTNPGVFVSGNAAWAAVEGADQLWNSDKSPWDPCPEGWMVPAFVEKPTLISPWTLFGNPSSTNPADYMAAEPAQDFASQYGWNFNLVDISDPEAPEDIYNIGYWPAAGARDFNGAYSNLATQGQYWSVNNNTSQWSIFSISDDQVNTNDTESNPANAMPVRCVKINE